MKQKLSLEKGKEKGGTSESKLKLFGDEKLNLFLEKKLVEGIRKGWNFGVHETRADEFKKEANRLEKEGFLEELIRVSGIKRWSKVKHEEALELRMHGISLQQTNPSSAARVLWGAAMTHKRIADVSEEQAKRIRDAGKVICVSLKHPEKEPWVATTPTVVLNSMGAALNREAKERRMEVKVLNMVAEILKKAGKLKEADMVEEFAKAELEKAENAERRRQQPPNA
ncbi:MAG: hypothetical protein AB1468_04455 [Candidatus Micrarchaeota archaeon]